MSDKETGASAGGLLNTLVEKFGWKPKEKPGASLAGVRTPAVATSTENADWSKITGVQPVGWELTKTPDSASTPEPTPTMMPPQPEPTSTVAPPAPSDELDWLKAAAGSPASPAADSVAPSTTELPDWLSAPTPTESVRAPLPPAETAETAPQQRLAGYQLIKGKEKDGKLMGRFQAPDGTIWDGIAKLASNGRVEIMGERVSTSEPVPTEPASAPMPAVESSDVLEYLKTAEAKLAAEKRLAPAPEPVAPLPVAEVPVVEAPAPMAAAEVKTENDPFATNREFNGHMEIIRNAQAVLAMGIELDYKDQKKALIAVAKANSLLPKLPPEVFKSVLLMRAVASGNPKFGRDDFQREMLAAMDRIKTGAAVKG